MAKETRAFAERHSVEVLQEMHCRCTEFDWLEVIHARGQRITYQRYNRELAPFSATTVLLVGALLRYGCEFDQWRGHIGWTRIQRDSLWCSDPSVPVRPGSLVETLDHEIEMDGWIAFWHGDGEDSDSGHHSFLDPLSGESTWQVPACVRRKLPRPIDGLFWWCLKCEAQIAFKDTCDVCGAVHSPDLHIEIVYSADWVEIRPAGRAAYYANETTGVSQYSHPGQKAPDTSVRPIQVECIPVRRC